MRRLHLLFFLFCALKVSDARAILETDADTYEVSTRVSHCIIPSSSETFTTTNSQPSLHQKAAEHVGGESLDSTSCDLDPHLASENLHQGASEHVEVRSVESTEVYDAERNKAEVQHLLHKSVVHASAAYNSDVGRGFKEDLAARKQLLSLNLGVDKASYAVLTFEEREGQKPLMTIAFPGTEGRSCVASYPHDAFNFGTSGMPADEIGLPGGGRSGFIKKYFEMRQALALAIDGFLEPRQLKGGDVDYLVTGHSLGGAMATCCAADLVFESAVGADVDLVTFAAPPVITAVDIPRLRERLRYALRVNRKGDRVPELKGFFRKGEHLGDEILLPKKGFWFWENHQILNFREDIMSGNVIIPESVSSEGSVSAH